MLFTVIFLITFRFFNMDKVLSFCKFIYFLLHFPPQTARLIAGGEKCSKQYDYLNNVLLLITLLLLFLLK